ncbi:MAG TPA: zf-TFIIB domain-containing protein [Vicinamibacteria bacterium]|nr:zf-TFIIB domain-containing protein [Vicinamibacteria bacterium]
MAAGRLGCPSCGAPVPPETRSCPYCATVLALVSCPSCFAPVFRGSKHCPSCGAAVSREAAEPRPPRPCPECRRDMGTVTVGSVTLDECGTCGGVFVDPPSFERICAEREQQSVVLQTRLPAPPATGTPRPDRYWPCPVCGRLMNRQNFARVSGVLVDVCKGHGVWFNHGELRAIVEFVRAGGLGRAREREKADLEEERRRLREERYAQSLRSGSPAPLESRSDHFDYGAVFSAARDLLKTLFD